MQSEQLRSHQCFETHCTAASETQFTTSCLPQISFLFSTFETSGSLSSLLFLPALLTLLLLSLFQTLYDSSTQKTLALSRRTPCSLAARQSSSRIVSSTAQLPPNKVAALAAMHAPPHPGKASQLLTLIVPHFPVFFTNQLFTSLASLTLLLLKRNFFSSLSFTS